MYNKKNKGVPKHFARKDTLLSLFTTTCTTSLVHWYWAKIKQYNYVKG